jgi:2-keto-3-deoxy-L-fuconate dehydrogenase
MRPRLDGKSCLITAAGAGIGRASALAFAQEGANVLATDIDAAALASLQSENPHIETARLDVTRADDLAAFPWPAVDVLFNVAGMVPSGSILDTDDKDFERCMALNVSAMRAVIRRVLPGMVARGGGAIINMASVASSVRGVPNRFAYAVSKAAVIGLTKSVAADFVSAGVRCNAIAPGTVDTPSLQARLAATGDYSAAHAAFMARQPMGRLGTAEEVAALAVHLAGDESAFTTGAVYVIDGGWTM